MTVRVKPGSSRRAVGPVENGVLVVRITARPVEGRANEALLKLLSEALGVAKSRLSLEAGFSGRIKSVLVEGLAPGEVASRLGLSR
ncbi:MAG TPA: DUF167 domain-containing protein [Deltaproteobacteria bacterium]|nr:DUF167 domain-containing protein [Deltaproteobacteria bacterium]